MYNVERSNHRSTTYIIRYIRQSNIKTSRQLYSVTMTTKATFCQLPTTCFHCQPCTNNTLRLRLLNSLKLRRTKYTTGDSCDGRISVLNHCLSWSKFVNTHFKKVKVGFFYSATYSDNVATMQPRFTIVGSGS